MKIIALLAFLTVGQCALLGTRKCTYGPSYWCSHIDHARECQTMQHCMATVWKDQLQGLTGATEDCFDVIGNLDDVRHASNLLEKMAESCTKMMTEKRSVCKELMRNNPNEVLLLLQSDLPSANIATAMGLCKSSSHTAPQLDLENKQHLVKSGNYCTDCLRFFGDLQDMVNKTAGQVAEKLKAKACVYLGSFEKLCNETVDTYVDFVFNILAQQLNPPDVCFVLQLCNSEVHDGLLKNYGSLKETVGGIVLKAKLGTLGCDLCEDLAKDIQNVLRDPDVQKKVMSVLENDVCARLPGNLSSECQSYVSEYGPLVFQVLVAELDPETICQSLGFCNSTKVEEKPGMVSVPLGKPMTTVRLLSPEQEDQAKLTPQCYVCELFMRKLESFIDTNSTEEEIIEDLKKACSLLPAKYVATCDNYVENYGRTILKLLMEEGPEAVCAALGLCALDQSVQVVHPVLVKSGEVCSLCELGMGYVRDFIANPDNVKIIEQLMDEICVLVPASYRPECEEIINTYAPIIIEELKKYDDPELVCTRLRFCTNSTTRTGSNVSGAGDKPLLFAPMMELLPAMPVIQCSHGPDVWCASMRNARYCNAMQYCVENRQLKLED